MGTSRIGQLTQIQSGIVFQEGFENDNFAQADGWAIVQGSPTTSLVQSKQGLKSFQCTGTGSTLTIVSKTINTSLLMPSSDGTWNAAVWFYDDGTTTAGTGPFFKIKDTNGNFFQVGVRNSVSTGFYVCNALDNTTQDNFGQTTTVARTVGWHKFIIFGKISISASIILYIDGHGFTLNFGLASTPSVLFLNSGTTSDAGGTFGYFDSLNVSWDSNVTIFASGNRALNVFDPNWNLLANLSNIGGIFTYGPQMGTSLEPYQIFAQISQTNSTSIEYQSPLINVYPGDAYLYQSVDFGRKFVNPQSIATALQVQNPSQGGNVEVLTYGYKDKFRGDIKALSGNSWDDQLRNWFAVARQGTPFSVLTDSDACVFTPIIANAPPGQPAVTGLLNNSILTGNPATGPYYILEDFAKKNKQRVTVASTNGTGPYTITFNETLQFPVTANSFYLRDQYFFPFMELDQPYDLSGLRWSDARNLLSDFTLSARDYVSIS